MNSPTMPVMTVEELDKRSFLHPFTPLATHLQTGPRVITQAEGIRVRDNHGNEFIDAMAGLWCVNIGWGREEMVEAIADQTRKLAFYHSFASMANEPAIRLADRVTQLAPGHMSKIFFGNSGSDANDTNVKLVWYYNNLRGKPGKKKIISRKRGYHGVTVASASLTGLDFVHKAFDLPIPQVRHTDNPHYYYNAPDGMSEREFSKYLAGKLEAMILAEGPETVGAFIAEPVMGAGGVIVPPDGYFDEIQPVLRRHDVLLIADEVICGFGRCGAWFGSQVYNIQPDIMAIAKGLTSGYVPMSGSLISDGMWEVLVDGTEQLGPFAHGFTYSAHPLAAAAGLANLDIMERENLPGNAAEVGAYFQQSLRAQFADHPLVGEVRGIALIAAVELVADKVAKTQLATELKVGPTLAKYSMDEGLICRQLSQANAIAFSPPLIVTRADCDEIIDRFGRALNRLTDELVASGAWSAPA